jgi:hypothetical protein
MKKNSSFYERENNLSPTETIVMIPKELEYLEKLVKLAKKWKEEV